MKTTFAALFIFLSANSYALSLGKYAGKTSRGEVCELEVREYISDKAEFDILEATFGTDHLGDTPDFHRETRVWTDRILNLPYGEVETEASCGYDSIKSDKKISLRYNYFGDISGNINQIELNFKDQYYKELSSFSAKKATFFFEVTSPACGMLKLKSVETCLNVRKISNK